MIPVVGPAWQAAADLQDGNYAGAAFNGLMAVSDATPIGPAAKAVRLVRAINKTRVAPLLARAGTATKRIRKIEQVPKGWEVHHTVPMGGWGPISAASRDAEGLWRNNPALMKAMPKEPHRRLTGAWNGKPQFGPVMGAWHGTNTLEKAGAAFLAGRVADSGENLARPYDPPVPPGRKR